MFDLKLNVIPNVMRTKMVIGKDILSMAEITIKKDGIRITKSVSDCGEEMQSKDNTTKILNDLTVPDLNVGNIKYKDAIQEMVAEFSSKVIAKTSIQSKIVLNEDIRGWEDAFGEFVNDGVIMQGVNQIIISTPDEDEGIQKLKMLLKISAVKGLNIDWQRCKFLFKEDFINQSESSPMVEAMQMKSEVERLERKKEDKRRNEGRQEAMLVSHDKKRCRDIIPETEGRSFGFDDVVGVKKKHKTWSSGGSTYASGTDTGQDGRTVGIGTTGRASI